MFTGIIEEVGVVKAIEREQDNVHFTIESGFTEELKVDQSISHNGCCLTVVDVTPKNYKVTAIKETLLKSNLGDLEINDEVNLERCMVLNGRLDGHIVQGHVDTTGKCISIEEMNGSTEFRFTYETDNVTVEKGSVTVNGISLTVVDSAPGAFSVHIIPYTLEHTNLKYLKLGDRVNLEFDIIGKYVEKLMATK